MSNIKRFEALYYSVLIMSRNQVVIIRFIFSQSKGFAQCNQVRFAHSKSSIKHCALGELVARRACEGASAWEYAWEMVTFGTHEVKMHVTLQSNGLVCDAIIEALL